MDHSVSLGDDGHIHVKFKGDSDVDDAQEFQAATLSLIDQHPTKKFNVLVDLTEGGSTSPAAVRIYAGLMQNPHFNKIAFINAGPIPKMFANMAINFSHKTEVQFFETVDEAEDWL